MWGNWQRMWVDIFFILSYNVLGVFIYKARISSIKKVENDVADNLIYLYLILSWS